MSSSQDFSLFSHLPKELQLSIWRHAISQLQPQIILIAQTHGVWATSNNFPVFSRQSNANSNFEYTNGTERYIMKSSRGVPVLLQTSVDAREQALKRYQLIILHGAKNIARFFDFERDTLALRCHPLWGSYPSADPELREVLGRVQNLILLRFRQRAHAFSTLSLGPLLRLRKLTLPKRREGSSGDQIETTLKRAVDAFWIEKLNPKQEDEGIQVTGPPEIVFWEPRELEEFEREFGESGIEE